MYHSYHFSGSSAIPMRESEISTEQMDIKIRRELRRLCWETMFGQELVKLTVMDLVTFSWHWLWRVVTLLAQLAVRLCWFLSWHALCLWRQRWYVLWNTGLFPNFMPIQPGRVYSCSKDSLSLTFINITVFWDMITSMCAFIAYLMMLTAWAVVVGGRGRARHLFPPLLNF
jgi:hypothetical protein